MTHVDSTPFNARRCVRQYFIVLFMFIVEHISSNMYPRGRDTEWLQDKSQLELEYTKWHNEYRATPYRHLRMHRNICGYVKYRATLYHEKRHFK